MGHRSNTVLVESGRATIYYSQWGARGLPELLLRGPKTFIAESRSDQRHEQLQDDVFCEGAALVDVDRQHLLWFGGVAHTRYLLPHRRAILQMLAAPWQGWTVAWAEQGVLDLAAYIGVDPATVRVTKTEPVDLDKLRTGVRGAYTILTVAEPRGATDYSLEPNPFVLLLSGPPLLDHLAGLEVTTLPREDNLGAGIVIDPIAQTIRLWCGPPEERPMARIAERWPSWRISADLNGLPHQLEVSGRDGGLVRLPDAEVEKVIRDNYLPRRLQWPT